MSNDKFEFGAPWWRASLKVGRLVGGAALALGGCYEEAVRPDLPAESQRPDEIEQRVDALALQQKDGWNVGQRGQPLQFEGSTVEDAAGTQDWRGSLESLAGTLAPAQPALLPYYVPTLFQSLIGQAGQGLRAVIRPVRTRAMDDDFGRGVALRSLFEEAGWPRDTAVVVDVPGPRAVALAAALSDRFEPVFTFGNWPHPLGVVPAHLTLGAALYFQPLFARNAAARLPGAPPVIVLDWNRLLPYRDEDTQFDNRYLVRLPTVDALQALGIRHVMYVTADGQREQDDLNVQLCELQQGGVDVKMVALSDFVQDGTAIAANDVEDDQEDEPAPWVDVWTLSFGGGPWWYGGSAEWHGGFWGAYGWYHPHGVTVGPPSGSRVLHSIASRWVPALRATALAAHITTRIDPATGAPAPHAPIGLVAVRTSRFDGALTGVRAGRAGSFSPGGYAMHYASGSSVGGSFHVGGASFARSGSLGRVGGGGSGG